VLYSSQDHLRTGMRDLDHPVLGGVENTDSLCFYISYSRIEFCLVVYTVPCLKTINSSGTLCSDYYSIPQRSTTQIRWKVLDIIADELLE
jgi:hypothetical protein